MSQNPQTVNRPYQVEGVSSPYGASRMPMRGEGRGENRVIPPRIFDTDGGIGQREFEGLGQIEEREAKDRREVGEMHRAREIEEPETTLGEGVVFKGSLSFKRLLRIDGTFEGELHSKGKLIIGPKGSVKSNLDLREAVIEGTVIGDITVSERLELRGDARVTGNICAKSISVDEGVSLNGHVKVGSRKGSVDLDRAEELGAGLGAESESEDVSF